MSYTGKDWPHPWDTQRHPKPTIDIVPRLHYAGKLCGGRENPYSEMYYTAADEIEKLRKILDDLGIEYDRTSVN